MRLALLTGLLLAATPVLAAPPGPIETQGVEITMSPRIAPAGWPATMLQLGLDIEAKSDEAALKLGFRSMGAVVDIDCSRGVNRVVSAETHAQANLQGVATPKPVSSQWMTPAPNSLILPVVQRACANQAAAPVAPAGAVPPTAAAGPPPRVTTGQGAPPAGGPVTTAHAPPAAPPAAAAAAHPPTTTPPATAAVVHPPPTSPPTTAAASQPPGPPRPPGNVVAQLTASPTAQGAQRVLAQVRGQIAPPLAGVVEQATVNGLQVYRASVTGFATQQDGRAFCAQVASVAKTCWVYTRSSRPAAAATPNPARPAATSPRPR